MSTFPIANGRAVEFCFRWKNEWKPDPPGRILDFDSDFDSDFDFDWRCRGAFIRFPSGGGVDPTGISKSKSTVQPHQEKLLAIALGAVTVTGDREQ